MRKLLLAADDLLQNGRFVNKLHMSNWTLTDTMFNLMVYTILLFAALMILVPSNPLLGFFVATLVSVPAFITACGMIVEGLLSLIKRPRKLSPDVILDGELYMEIAERLKSRGINSTKKFILDQPHYLDTCMTLSSSFRWPGDYSSRYPTVSLVYTNDDPLGTAETITSILNKRGFMSADDIESLLKIGDEVQTPLRDGAL